MRISDWSSDVCSSDLTLRGLIRFAVGLSGLGLRRVSRSGLEHVLQNIGQNLVVGVAAALCLARRRHLRLEQLGQFAAHLVASSLPFSSASLLFSGSPFFLSISSPSLSPSSFPLPAVWFGFSP